MAVSDSACDQVFTHDRMTHYSLLSELSSRAAAPGCRATGGNLPGGTLSLRSPAFSCHRRQGERGAPQAAHLSSV